MGVRKTESELPIGISSFDELGQAAVSVTGKVAIVSYLSSPIVVDRIQNYVVFVTDATLRARVDTYTWTLKINGFDFPNSKKETNLGLFEFKPPLEGALVVAVELKDSASVVLAKVELNQSIISPNAFVDQLIDSLKTGANAADPDTTKEIFNDLKCYIDAILPVAAQPLLNSFISSIAYTSTLKNNKVTRNKKLEEVAKILNDGKHSELFAKTKDNGIGVCAVKPYLLSMYLNIGVNTPVTLTKIPEDKSGKETALKTIETAFGKLTEPQKITLFNRLRFPKSNIAACNLVMEGLRKEYYSAILFKDLLTSANKTKTREIITHYENGPIKP